MERPDERTLDRYIKVKRLTNSPQEGESEAAKRTLKRWQEQWRMKGIDIEKEATIWERINSDQPEEDEPPHWGDVYREQQQQKQDEWKQRFTEWGQAASNAFSWAANMASQAFSVQEARTLATEDTYTRIQMRQNPTGSVSLTVRIAPETVEFIQHLTEEQRITYANTVAQRVASDLYNSL